MTEIFEYPQIIFDTETTGITGGRVIEIGAVVIDTSGEIISEFDTLVRQSRDILYSPRSAKALSINNIDREEVLNSGISEQEAGEKFAKWIAESKEKFGANCMRAYNQQFDFGKIRRHPLDPFMHKGGSIPEGECIMMAAYKLMHEAGALVKHPGKDAEADYFGAPEDDIGRYKWPSALESVTYFESLGYHIPDEVEHRALPDARREAAIAVAIRCEEVGSGPISNIDETVNNSSPLDSDVMGDFDEALQELRNLHGAAQQEELQELRNLHGEALHESLQELRNLHGEALADARQALRDQLGELLSDGTIHPDEYAESLESEEAELVSQAGEDLRQAEEDLRRQSLEDLRQTEEDLRNQNLDNLRQAEEDLRREWNQ